ncbi:HTH-type transcriptional regulator CynR [Spirochaetia bacterium]|nr:HTH-type transcriptional regulator CynR [Spirochaetia bacterium]
MCDMTLEQIRYFTDIAEHGSFSGAADRWYITQPAVSKQIRSLEEELGCKLFDRQRGGGNNHVALTEIGQQILPLIRNILDQYEAVKQNIDAYKKNKQVIRISASPMTDVYGITKIFTQFEKRSQDIQIQLLEYAEWDVISRLATGESDIAIIREELLTTGQFDVVPLVTDYLAFFCVSSHPLAAQHTVTIEQIANEPLALPPDNSYMGRCPMDLFRKKGIIPRVLSRIQPGTIINNFVNDYSSTLLFAKYYDINPSPQIKVIPLDPPCKSTVVLAYKKTGKKNTIIERLITYMAKSFPCP